MFVLRSLFSEKGIKYLIYIFLKKNFNMVQLQTFTPSDYLLKIIAVIIISYKSKEKIRKNNLILLK